MNLPLGISNSRAVIMASPSFADASSFGCISTLIKVHPIREGFACFC